MNSNKKRTNNLIKNLYFEDHYIEKNPSLHKVDSPWKISKILPLIDNFIYYLNNKEEINILDVGGGAGLILKEIASNIEKKFNIKVNKLALDLSPGILEIQKKNNPDLKRSLNEDICNTSLGNKEIDLTLIIDVLEHIPTLKIALKELKRISNFVLFKVPLDDCLHYKIENFLSRGKFRQYDIETSGHVKLFNFNSLKYQIEKQMGVFLDYYFTNISKYIWNSAHYRHKIRRKDKIIHLISMLLFKISPRITSLLSRDHIMILSKCY